VRPRDHADVVDENVRADRQVHQRVEQPEIIDTGQASAASVFDRVDCHDSISSRAGHSGAGWDR